MTSTAASTSSSRRSAARRARPAAPPLLRGRVRVAPAPQRLPRLPLRPWAEAVEPAAPAAPVDVPPAPVVAVSAKPVLEPRSLTDSGAFVSAAGLTVDEVTATAGFRTPETLRRAFARRVGASPTEYRDRFRSFQPA